MNDFRWTEERRGVVVECAACHGTGLRVYEEPQWRRLLCPGCKGAGKQLLAVAPPTGAGSADGRTDG